MADNIIDLKTIPPGTEMTITLNTDMYIRLQQLLLEALPYKSEEEFKEVIKEVTKGEPKEGLAYHAHTLIYLISILEESAKKAGKIVDKKFDLEAKKLVD